MKKKFVKQFLVFTLAVVMMVGALPVSAETPLVPAEGEDQAGDETSLMAPILKLYKDEDGIVKGFEISAQSEGSTYYGLLTSEQWKKNDVSSLKNDLWLFPDQVDKVSLSGLLRGYELNTGTYYFAAYTKEDYDSDAKSSELTVLESYPINVTVTEAVDALTYKTGSITGDYYFTDILAADCDFAEAKISGRWWESIIYADMEYGVCRCGYVNDGTLLELKTRKTDAGETKCDTSIVKYQKFSANGTYEEKRTAMPEVNIVEEDGVFQKIEVTNNSLDYAYVRVGLATQKEIAATINPYEIEGVDLEAGETCSVDLSRIIDRIDCEPGEYYLVMRADNYKDEPSEWKVEEDNPFVLTEITDADDTIVYQPGDLSGDKFLTGISVKDYGYAAKNSDSDYYNYSVLGSKGDYFYFSDTIEALLLGKVEKAEKGYKIVQKKYTKFEKGETFVEPQAAAPTVTFVKDSDGNYSGVEIINNEKSSNTRILYGFAPDDQLYGSWYDHHSEVVKSGEKIVYPFDDMHLPSLKQTDDLVFKCIAVDQETGLYSKVLRLECPITVETKEYTGDEVTVYRTKEIHYGGAKLYTAVSQFPENARYVFADNARLKKTEDQSQWKSEYWYGSTVDSLSYVQMETGKDTVKLIYTEIPADKVKIEKIDAVQKNTLFLDYDRYHAFVASGGSITVDENNEVQVSTENFGSNEKWSLEYLYEKFTNTDVYTFVKNIADSIKYIVGSFWNSKEGEFAAVGYYDLEGNEIGEKSISKQDVVLVKYAPETVWVQSMELDAPKTMNVGQTGKVTAALDAGQDKYPFGRTPQVRFESSNSQVVSVDANTGVLKAGNVKGTVTITAYADEALRQEQGLKEIVTATVTITVSGAENDAPTDKKEPVTEVYKDVPSGSWFVSAVQYVYEKGLMTGYNGEFTPNSTMTRAMIVETLYRMAGKPEVTDYTKYNSFKDLSEAWFKTSVAWALNEGIATGDTYANTFDPNKAVTREQLAAFLYRFANYMGEDVTLQGDMETLLNGSKPNVWCEKEFAWAIEQKLISGLQKKDAAGNVSYDLAPRGTATRAQLATILQRYCED